MDTANTLEGSEDEPELDDRMFIELGRYHFMLSEKIFKSLVVAVDAASINEYLYHSFPEYGNFESYLLNLLLSVYTTYVHLNEFHQYSKKQKKELIELLWSERQTNFEDDVSFRNVHLTEEQVETAILVYRGVYSGIGELQMLLKVV